MDPTSFDRIAKRVGGVVSRRAGLKAALGGLGGLAVADAGATRRGVQPDRRSRVKPEGPCGDGSVKDNRCTTNKQCCTGYCKKGLRNKDGKGRCRCIKKGKPCKPSQTCCGTTVCVDGRCGTGKAPVPTGQPCGAGDVCQDAAASCTGYAGGSPAGTWCLLPAGAACSAGSWCRSGSCPAGVCAAASGESCDNAPCANPSASCSAYDIGPGSPAGKYCVLPLSSGCVADDDCVSAFCQGGTCQKCTVCLGGTCDYTVLFEAVTAATSGASIGIAPGVYDDTAIFNVSMSVRRCGSRGTVDVTGQSGTPNFNGQAAIGMSGDGIDVTISDMTIRGADGDQVVRIELNGLAENSMTLNRCVVTMVDGGQVYTNPITVYKGSSLTLNECEISGNTSPSEGTLTVDTAIFVATDTTFSGNTAPKGGGVYVKESTVTLTRCTFSGNTADSYGGAIHIEACATPVTLVDCTITGNSAAERGGGISINAGTDTTLLTLSGTTTVTGNSVTEGASGHGSGIVSLSNGGTVTITGADTRTSGNTTPPDQCERSTNNGSSWTTVTGCAF